MNSSCPFCLEMNGLSTPYHDSQYHNMVKQGTTCILESKYFVVLPDFGPIVVGHALIIPKRHVTSFACLNDYEINDLENLICKLKNYISKKYDLFTEFFEHGSDISLVNSMASVSHAHLHIMPVKQQTSLENTKLTWFKSNYNSLINDIDAQKRGYLLFRQSDGQILIAKYEMAISQFFRQYYADLYANEKWNWKIDRNKEMLLETLSFYSDLKSTWEDI